MGCKALDTKMYSTPICLHSSIKEVDKFKASAEKKLPEGQ